MNKISFLKKIYSLIIFILFILNFGSTSFAKNINKFNIIGNERVSNETIIMFSKLKVNQKIDDIILNESLKNLYYTNYFEKVTISNDKGTITIKVKENPIIQKVQINGIDDNSILENLEKITLKAKVSFR